MSSAGGQEDLAVGATRSFATTHWSVVLAAEQAASPQRTEALEKLCRIYWFPLLGSAIERAFAMLGMAVGCTAGGAWAGPSPALPPHRELMVPGIHGYPDEVSVQPGDAINFKISSDTNYTFQIFRLGLDTDSPSGDVPASALDTITTPRQQPICPGSYVYVADGLPPTNALAGLTLECWVRPFVALPSGFEGLITQYDPSQAGFGLFVQFNTTNNGTVAFYVGDGGTVNLANWLQAGFDFLAPEWSQLKWHHVVGTWDGAAQRLWVDGQLTASHSFAGPVKPGSAPLRLGAYGENSKANHFFNGDLAMPVIYDRALSEAEITNHFSQVHTGGSPPRPFDTNNVPSEVLGCWPLTEERGEGVTDISAFGRVGQIINHATWQIGGPSFNAGAVGEFDKYQPTTDPTRGHGLRFASDDLFDCRWTNTLSWVVPANAASGIYVARLRYPAEAGTNAFYHHIVFIVRKPDSQPAAPILLVFPLNTCVAYNSQPLVPDQFAPGSLFQQVFGTEGNMRVGGPDVPGFSAYVGHQNYAPTAHLGLRMPLLVADPYAINGYLFDGSDYSHLTPATRCTQVWLERNGYRYDVITDLDLHKNPGALGGYRTVIIAGHSEYWSVPAYDSLKSYLQSNGNLVVLSGNTMYWRVSFDPDCTVMEIRKVDGVGEQYQGRRGEVWHSDDGLRGGLMRESGFPGWQLIGLETQGIDTFATFYLTNLSHPLFSGLAVTNGQATCAGLVGHESDARVSTLEANRLLAGNPVPNTATIPLEPPGIVTLATGLLDPGETANDDYRDYFMQILGIKLPPPVHSADLIYWERPDGGRVFNAGGIATGIGLSRDPVFAGLVSNVLATFTKPDTWVDFNWTGSQSGTFDFPFSTLASGLSAAPWGGTLRIKAGHTAETGTISKRIYINSYGGAATIGR